MLLTELTAQYHTNMESLHPNITIIPSGKYQPIKFTNNRQVTESIPKRLFDQANLMKKTLYQRSMQVQILYYMCCMFRSYSTCTTTVLPVHVVPKVSVLIPVGRFYHYSLQVPKIGTKQVFLAINPTPGGVRPYNNSSPVRPSPPPSRPQQPPQRPVPQTSDQV